MRPIPANAHLRIGLLGGSFNPAHEGHLHISLEALHRLQLDQVWWLVTPQNPLKPSHNLAPIEKRAAIAEELTAGVPQILITDIEKHLGTRYSRDTITLLQRQ